MSTALNFILQYLPTFGINELGRDDSLSFVALFVAGAILTFGTPVVGLLADRFGRLRIMVPAALLIGASACFAFAVADPADHRAAHPSSRSPVQPLSRRSACHPDPSISAPISAPPIDVTHNPTYLPPSKRFDDTHRNDSTNAA